MLKREFGRWYFSKRPVRATLIVFLLPGCDLHFGILERIEPAGIQAFIPEGVIERLDERVIRRLPGLRNLILTLSCIHSKAGQHEFQTPALIRPGDRTSHRFIHLQHALPFRYVTSGDSSSSMHSPAQRRRSVVSRSPPGRGRRVAQPSTCLRQDLPRSGARPQGGRRTDRGSLVCSLRVACFRSFAGPLEIPRSRCCACIVIPRRHAQFGAREACLDFTQRKNSLVHHGHAVRAWQLSTGLTTAYVDKVSGCASSRPLLQFVDSAGSRSFREIVIHRLAGFLR